MPRDDAAQVFGVDRLDREGGAGDHHLVALARRAGPGGGGDLGVADDHPAVALDDAAEQLVRDAEYRQLAVFTPPKNPLLIGAYVGTIGQIAITGAANNGAVQVGDNLGNFLFSGKDQGGVFQNAAFVQAIVSTVTANSVSPAANIDFPACTGSTSTITHFAVGTASSGAGKLLYSGTVTPNIVVSTSVPQTLTTGSTITED